MPTDGVPWTRTMDAEEEIDLRRKKALQEEEQLRLRTMQQQADEQLQIQNEQIRLKKLKEEQEEQVRLKKLEEEQIRLQLLQQQQEEEVKKQQEAIRLKLQMEMTQKLNEEMQKIEEQNKQRQEELKQMQLQSQLAHDEEVKRQMEERQQATESQQRKEQEVRQKEEQEISRKEIAEEQQKESNQRQVKDKEGEELRSREFLEEQKLQLEEMARAQCVRNILQKQRDEDQRFKEDQIQKTSEREQERRHEEEHLRKQEEMHKKIEEHNKRRAEERQQFLLQNEEKKQANEEKKRIEEEKKAKKKKEDKEAAEEKRKKEQREEEIREKYERTYRIMTTPMVVLPAALKLPSGACASTPDNTVDADDSHIDLFNNSQESEISTRPMNKAKVPTDSGGARKKNDPCTSAVTVHDISRDSLNSSKSTSAVKRIADKVIKSPQKLVVKMKAFGRKKRTAYPWEVYGNQTLNLTGGYNLFKSFPANVQYSTTEHEFSPKHGEVYLIRCQENETVVDVYNCDGQLWVNQGVRQDGNVKLATYYARSKEHVDYMSKTKSQRGPQAPKSWNLQWKKLVYELKEDKYCETSLDGKHIIVHYVGNPEFALHKDDDEHVTKKLKGDEQPHSDNAGSDVHKGHSQPNTDPNFKVPDIPRITRPRATQSSAASSAVTDNDIEEDDHDFVNLDQTLEEDLIEEHRREGTVQSTLLFDQLVEPQHNIPTTLMPFQSLIVSEQMQKDYDIPHNANLLEAQCIRVRPTCRGGLTAEQVKSSLQFAEQKDLHNQAHETLICNPKGGQIYYFDHKHLAAEHKNWDAHLKCDGLRWKACRRYQQIQKGVPIECQNYSVKTGFSPDNPRTYQVSSEFKKQIFINTETQKCMVHYFGDESIALKAPHRSAKNAVAALVRVTPLVVERIKTFGLQRPTQIYNDMMSHTAPGQLGVLQNPRNVDQIKYQQRKTRAQLTLNDNNVTNLSHAQQFLSEDNFIRSINQGPEVSAVCFTNQSIDELNSAIRNANDSHTMIYGTDTTYIDSPFWLTYDHYRHPLLERVTPRAGSVQNIYI